MQTQRAEQIDDADDRVIDSSFIRADLNCSDRSVRDYKAKKILPPPDGNMLGKDIWRLSTYRRFKEDLWAGKFAKLKRLPHLRDRKPAA